MAGHVAFHEDAPPAQAAASSFQKVLHRGRSAVYTVSTIALLLASVVMTYGVVMRHAAGIAVIWQDEVCVFLLVGATFLSAASVQEKRGHVGIEAIASLLSPAANRVRRLVSDLLSGLFCGFFTWKSAELLHEAWVDGQTSESPWGPPLWIPYSLMTVGMLLLTCQLFLQAFNGLTGRPTGGPATVHTVGHGG